MPSPSVSVGGVAGGLEPTSEANNNNDHDVGGSAGAGGEQFIDEASLSMIDRIDQAIHGFQTDFGHFLEGEGHQRAGQQMRLDESRSSVAKGLFGAADELGKGKSFLYQQLNTLLSKMVAVLARAQSATSLAMEARRRVLESELIRSQTLKHDHQRLLSELAARSAETRAREEQQEAQQERNEELYNWPTAALPPSAAPVDDLVADHMQLRQAHSELQVRCELLEEEIATRVEDAQHARQDAAAALTEALRGNKNEHGFDNDGNGDTGAAAPLAGTDVNNAGAGVGLGAKGGSALPTPASADAATNAVAVVNSRPGTAASRPSRPPSAKDIRQAVAADKGWADVEALLDATEADARRKELSPTPVQVAIGSLSLREMRSTFGRRASSAHGQSKQHHQRPRSHSGRGGRRGHNNPNHPVEAVATLDWSGGSGDPQKHQKHPPSHDALTFGDLLRREQHKPRVGRR